MKLYTTQYEIDHAYTMNAPFRVWLTPQSSSDLIIESDIAPSKLLQAAKVEPDAEVAAWLAKK